MSTENLDRLLAAAHDFDASDLHLVAGVPPAFRVNGEIIIADEDTLGESEAEQMAYSLLNDRQREKFDQEWELCISLLHPVAGRVRATFYRRNGHPEMSFRFCGDRIATREELGLPEKIDELARKPNGLVLVTGPTGAGKTTTLNYMVDLINSERRCKVVTIEDPIEFVHENKRAIVVQQEVLTDVRSFNRALIHVLRQDPDVIVVGEMRDFEAISTALTALKPAIWSWRPCTRPMSPTRWSELWASSKAAPSARSCFSWPTRSKASSPRNCCRRRTAPGGCWPTS